MKKLEKLLRGVVNPHGDIDVPALSDKITAMFTGTLVVSAAGQDVGKATIGDKQFTHLEMEAALCVWETLNQWTEGSEDAIEAMRLNVDCMDTTISLEWIEMREQTGSGEMRSQSIVLGKWCLEIYYLLTKNDPEFFSFWSYDWEVIPAMLTYAVCKDGKASMYRGDYVYTGGELVAPESAAAFVAHHFLWETYKRECRDEAKKQWGYEDLVVDHADRLYDQGFVSGDDPATFIKWLGNKYDLTPVDMPWGRV